MQVGLAGETLSFRDEHLILYRPGRPPDVWLDLDYSPLLDESGQPAGVLAIVVETTERVIAEKALRASEAQFRTFAAAMPHHVWAATPDGKLDWFNDKVVEYTGASLEALRGDGWGQVVHPEDIGLAVEAWQKALATASTAGTSPAPCRSATMPARWCVGSAPTPISTTGSRRSVRCARAKPISRACSRSARSAASRCS